MDKNASRFALTIAAVISAAAGALAARGNDLFHQMADPQSEPTFGTGSAPDGTWAAYEDRFRAGKAWMKQQNTEEAWINASSDGTKLHARYLKCSEPKRILLCAHGYRSSADSDFAGIAPWLHEQQCDLLLIDERGCGKSGGSYIAFGAKEYQDILDWVRWLEHRNTARLPIYLYGISMGASAVMKAASVTLPPDVRGMIADCGFASLRDVCRDVARKWYRLPPKMADILDLECRRQGGYALEDAAPERTLGDCRIPALFIHGTADDYVAPEHAARNYAACGSPKKRIIWIENAPHACSFFEDPEKYHEAVSALFRQCEGGAGQTE